MSNHPDARGEIKRVFADGDHVILHSHWHGLSDNPRGEAVVDMARSSSTGTRSSRSRRRRPTPTRCSKLRRTFRSISHGELLFLARQMSRRRVLVFVPHHEHAGKQHHGADALPKQQIMKVYHRPNVFLAALRVPPNPRSAFYSHVAIVQKAKHSEAVPLQPALSNQHSLCAPKSIPCETTLSTLYSQDQLLAQSASRS